MLNVTVDRSWTIHNQFTMISNQSMFDKRITPTAKSFLHLIFALPPGWKHNFEGWAAELNIGVKSVKKALANLIEFGYAYCVQHKDEKGLFQKAEYYFYQTPSANPYIPHPDSESPEYQGFIRNPESGEPIRENRSGELSNTVKSNTQQCVKSVCQEPTDRSSEQIEKVQNQLMAEYAFVSEEDQPFYTEAVRLLTEVLTTGRINKSRTVHPDELMLRLKQIHETEHSFIPFMTKLHHACEQALTSLRFPKGRKNFLKSVMTEFIQNYVLCSAHAVQHPESSASDEEQTLSFSEMLRQMNPDNSYSHDEEFQSEEDFACYDDEDREVKLCHIPEHFAQHTNTMINALKYLFCFSYNSSNEHYRKFTETVITCLAEVLHTGKINYTQSISPGRIIDRLNEINSSSEDSLIEWLQAFTYHYRKKLNQKMASNEEIRNSYAFLKTLAVNHLLKDYHSREVF